MTAGRSWGATLRPLAITKSATAALHARIGSRRVSHRAIPKGGRAARTGPRPTLWQRYGSRSQLGCRGKERKVPYPEALTQVAKDKALKGDQRAAQTLINLMRELDILKPQKLMVDNW